MVVARPSYKTFADQDPYPFFEDIRREARVYWDEGMQAWLVTGYDDCVFVLKREDLFAGPWPQRGFAELFGRYGLFMLSGEEHRKLYTRITQFFSPRIIKEYRASFIRPLIEDRLDQFAGQGRAELVTAYTEQIPVRVIASMLGLPWQDEKLAANCWAWTEDFLRHTGTFLLPDGGAGTLEGAVRSMRRLDTLLRPLVRDRAHQPEDSYINVLWEVGASIFDDWNEEDVLDQCRFLFIAGMHTTSEFIGNAVYLLLTDEALRDRVAADREGLLSKYVEEALRLSPPMHIRLRLAAEDVELAGARIKKGDAVCTLNAAANRDPDQYACPHAVDLARTPITGHLAFNIGPRFCSGAPLARAEAFEALDALLTRLPNLRLDPTAERPRLRGFLQRGYKPLHALFDPAKKQG